MNNYQITQLDSSYCIGITHPSSCVKQYYVLEIINNNPIIKCFKEKTEPLQKRYGPQVKGHGGKIKRW